MSTGAIVLSTTDNFTDITVKDDLAKIWAERKLVLLPPVV